MIRLIKMIKPVKMRSPKLLKMMRELNRLRLSLLKPSLFVLLLERRPRDAHAPPHLARLHLLRGHEPSQRQPPNRAQELSLPVVHLLDVSLSRLQSLTDETIKG